MRYVKSKALRVILPILIFLLSCVVAYGAAALFTSWVRGNGDGDISSLPFETVTEFSMTEQEADLVFKRAGDRKSFRLSFTNSSEESLSFSYALDYDKSAIDAELASAILVYFDGELLGTLSEACALSELSLGSGYIAAGTSEDNHLLELELHRATPDGYYDGRELSFNVTAYTATFDYEKHIIVKNEEELIRALDDVNTGLLEGIVIVLVDDISLSRDYSVSYPTTIDLYGHTLSTGANTLMVDAAGQVDIISTARMLSDSYPSVNITLDGESTFLNIGDIYSWGGADISALISRSVTVNSCDAALAAEAVLRQVEESLAHGVISGENLEVFSGAYCYAELVGVNANGDGYTYSDGVLTAVTADLSHVTEITVGGERIEFVISGSGEDAIFASILQEELAHLPASNIEKVTGDLFLPKSVKDKNATITWTSASPLTISNDGRISDVVSENEPVTLFAEIRINDRVFTTEYSFLVSSQNNETKFAYLVAQLSPITLEYVYSGENGDRAFYYLPIVDSVNGAEGKYDYRNVFSTPEAQDTAHYTWEGYRDIGLTSIDYSISNTYNYLTFEEGEGYGYVYLNTAVFYTFGQLNITGTFKNGEVYDGVVNVIIKLGDNKDLQNKVFLHVESTLEDTDILSNIITTRIADGMLNERGDFYLPSGYMTYSINYGIPESSKGIITEIIPPRTGDNDTEKALVKLDPSMFYSTDTAIGVTVTVQLASAATTSETRILYFDVPAVIKPDESGFGNLGVFNAIKYQTLLQLPEEERTDLADTENTEGYTYSTGFALSGSTLVNKTGAYILVRDAREAGVTQLVLNVKGDTASTDNTEAYVLSRLIEWATASSVYEARAVWSGAAAGVSSDGNAYLTEGELSVLDAYWRSLFGEAIPDDVKAQAFESAVGRIIVDGEAINDFILNTANLDLTLYFKYVETLQWAINKVDASGESGKVYDDGPPNLGQLLRYYTFDANGVPTYSNRYSWQQSPYNTSEFYREDDTDYLSEGESQIMMSLLLNWCYNSTGSDTRGRQFCELFMESTIVPTVLRAGGVGLIIREMYRELGTDVSDFTSEVEFLAGGFVPSVTALDNSLTGLQHYVNLERLYITGERGVTVGGKEVGLSAFLSSTGITGSFNQITTNNTRITDLIISAAARNHVSFDVSFTSRLSELTRLSYAYNSGISNVGPLVDVDMTKIEYLNISGVGVSFEFSEYVLENVYYASGRSAEVWYIPDGGTTETLYMREGEVAESLTYLNEINRIRAEYLQLCRQLETADGTDEIYWRIESGNMMYYVTAAGQLPTVNSADAMHAMLKNYYYCTESFTQGGTTLTAGHIYRITLSGSNVVYTDCGLASVSRLNNAQDLPSAEEAIPEDERGEFIASTETESLSRDPVTTVGEEEELYSANRFVIRLNSTNAISTTVYYLGYRIDSTVTVVGERVSEYTGRRTAEKTEYYYYTGASSTVNIDGTNVSLTPNTVVRVDWTYDESTGYTWTEYTTTTTTYSLNLVYYTNRNLTDASRVVVEEADWTAVYRYDNRGRLQETFQKSAYIGNKPANTSVPTSDSGSEEGSIETSITVTPLYSYVGEVSSLNKAEIDSAALELSRSTTAYYQYTGANSTAGNPAYYVNGVLQNYAYTRNAYYRYAFDNNGYRWIATNGNAFTGAVGNAGSMDAILAEANSHAGASFDALMGNYYGNYYAYGGPDFTTANGNYYEQGGIYRLLLDENNEFYFEHEDLEKMDLVTYSFETVTSVQSETGLLGIARRADASMMGRIYYYSGGNDFHHQGRSFYILTMSETGEFFMEKFGAISAQLQETNGDGQVISRFKNDRINEVAGFYIGTGGTHRVVVSAVVIDESGEHFVRKFIVDVTGWDSAD